MKSEGLVGDCQKAPQSPFFLTGSHPRGVVFPAVGVPEPAELRAPVHPSPLEPVEACLSQLRANIFVSFFC